MNKLFIYTFTILLLQGCSNETKLTEEDAILFLDEMEEFSAEEGPIASSAYWISSNFITYDSQKVVADYSKRYSLLSVENARRAAEFDDVDVTKDTRRKLNFVKSGFVMPSPLDEGLATEIANLKAELSAMYGSGRHCFEDGTCYDLEGFEQIIDNSRNPEDLLMAWSGWREIGKPMKEKYLRMVEIGEMGSKDLGFEGLSDLWFSKYDMSSDEFLSDVDRVWEEVKPLYDALHCHVRGELNEFYGDEVVKNDGMIPAHILGNMWAQSWSNIYDLVYEPSSVDASINLTQIIQEENLSEVDMVRVAEDFFVSLGFERLADTFWERSLFVKPRDRDVTCHASAWNLDSEEDLRIKMCIQKNEEDFVTIHHELGHIFYYQAYNHLPSIYESGANDGFHEAVGDLLSLSITPAYLKELGYINEEQYLDAISDPISLLMKQALEGIVVIPWTLILDKWRSQVFSGDVEADQLNNLWWELRESYQGVKAPIARDYDAFDPGAKYHIPGNTPYTRYYLARIMQYQFHESLCNDIGFDGPLHECTIYNNPEAGEKLKSMLALGSSVPWQDAFEELTGVRELSGESIINYYSPLKEWLDEKNEGRQCGW